MSLRQTLDGYAADAARVTFGEGISAHPSMARKMIREALATEGQRADDMTDCELKDFADRIIQALVQFSDVQGQDLRRAIAEGNFISCEHAETCERIRSEAGQPAKKGEGKRHAESNHEMVDAEREHGRAVANGVVHSRLRGARG